MQLLAFVPRRTRNCAAKRQKEVEFGTFRVCTQELQAQAGVFILESEDKNTVFSDESNRGVKPQPHARRRTKRTSCSLQDQREFDVSQILKADACLKNNWRNRSASTFLPRWCGPGNPSDPRQL